MTSDAGRFDALPPSVDLDETITEIDPDDVPDPHAGRNVAIDEALRDGG